MPSPFWITNPFSPSDLGPQHKSSPLNNWIEVVSDLPILPPRKGAYGIVLQDTFLSYFKRRCLTGCLQSISVVASSRKSELGIRAHVHSDFSYIAPLPNSSRGLLCPEHSAVDTSSFNPGEVSPSAPPVKVSPLLLSGVWL